MKRIVAIVTGTRAEYGLFVPILRKIEKSGTLDYALYVTGMHLSPEFGQTVGQIKKDGFRIAKAIDALNADDKGSGMGAYIGQFTASLAREFEKSRPDILLVLGDRGEMIAGAIAANCMNIPVAHIHGGEVSGSVDDGFRHAITKLSHIHLCATAGSAKRIIKMGEESDRVHVVGAPGLDNLEVSSPDLEKLAKRLKIDPKKPLVLMVQHAVVQECQDAPKQADGTLSALAKLGYQSVVIYPNADPGGREIINVIQRYEKMHPFIKTYKSLGREEYLGLMKLADVMVGNSSSGIIEASSFKLPVVNIGSRQAGRERACNVIDVPYGRAAVLRGINKALTDKEFKRKLASCKNPYGDGKASERIVKILSELKIDETLLSKRLRY